MKKEAIAPWLVVGAGILWGTMGIFVRHFNAMGLTSLQISAIRLTVAAVVFLLSLLLEKKDGRKIDKKDIGWFLLIGIFSVFAMSVCYFSSITLGSLAMAAILLYTAPFFVLICSCLLFGEKITWVKGIALVTAFAGCVLVVGMGQGRFWGIFFGLLSGISYASYSIFGTILLKKYSSLTITAISFSIAAVVTLLCCNAGDMVAKLTEAGSVGTFFWCLGLGLITAAMPFSLYTIGLKNMAAGKAAILAFIEPMVAALLGATLFNEMLGISGVFGVLLILFAVVLLNGKEKILQNKIIFTFFEKDIAIFAIL
ncbi:MAG: EamA family transporter [Ruminococcaceae bacterium]|nr:EamA family transporter [Oscillospiraceae bacterium]